MILSFVKMVHRERKMVRRVRRVRTVLKSTVHWVRPAQTKAQFTGADLRRHGAGF
jgi:hypothetical protein